jgi:hypothetical protein
MLPITIADQILTTAEKSRVIMQEKEEFYGMIHQARTEFLGKNEFQDHSWQWARELDDEGFFLFCYLMHDYDEKLLSKNSYQDTINTLNLLRNRLLPQNLKDHGITLMDQFQILFNLYERLKRENMHWDACEEFVQEQLKMHLQQN